MSFTKINGCAAIRFATLDELFSNYLLNEIRHCGQPRCEIIAEMLEKNFRYKNMTEIVRLLREFGMQWKDNTFQSIKKWKPTVDNDTGALFETARHIIQITDLMLLIADRFAEPPESKGSRHGPQYD